MRMEEYRPRRKPKTGWVAYVLVAVLVIGGTWYWLKHTHYADRAEKPTTSAPAVESPRGSAPTSGPAAEPPLPSAASLSAYGPKGMTPELSERIGPSPITLPPVGPDEAQSLLREGLELYAKDQDLLRARSLLNRAYGSGHLAEEQSAKARAALEDLANRTVLRRDSCVDTQDPYLLAHTFQPGEMLLSKRRPGTGEVVQPGVIARNHLNVPYGVVAWVNGLDNSTQFRAGQSYKLVRGPFHMVVYKGRFAADIYLQDLFVRRVPVGIGASETPTPEGYFRIVSWKGKTTHSPYYPPAETGRPNVAILPGQPGYPLGADGLNIKLEGIPELGTTIRASQSYAIHSTNDPSSIGLAASRGCIRLRDEDMRFVYGAFQDYAAPGDTKATWNRWSTITVRP